MVHPALAAAGLAVGVKVVDELFSDADHDTVVRDTFAELEREVPANANLYVDHIYDDKPNPRTGLQKFDLEHVPDIVVRSGAANNLIIEVETEDTLDGEALDQLDEFRLQGYRRVLVVPDGNSEAVSEFEADLDDEVPGVINVATPDTVTELL